MMNDRPSYMTEEQHKIMEEYKLRVEHAAKLMSVDLMQHAQIWLKETMRATHSS